MHIRVFSGSVHSSCTRRHAIQGTCKRIHTLASIESNTYTSQIGLLPKDNHEQIPFAYKLYQRTDQAGLHLAAGFKQTFAQNVSVEFMGVW